MVGMCKFTEWRVALGVLDFRFMGGSMGSVVGEKLCLLIETSIKESLPLVIVSASGGARMQESILSLMQMAKTSAALQNMHHTGFLIFLFSQIQLQVESRLHLQPLATLSSRSPML